MPGMSGLDVVRIAREHGYDGKVVILSGYSDFNYARTAIRYGVLSYLTKPIDEDELLEIVTQIRNQLDSDASARDSSAHYRQKAYDSIIRDLLAGTAAYDRLDRAELHLNADVYQVIIYEKYSHRTEDASYRFSDLLRVTNQDHNSFDHITDDSREIILLKGSFATRKIRQPFWNAFNGSISRKRIPLWTVCFSLTVALYHIWKRSRSPIQTLPG